PSVVEPERVQMGAHQPDLSRRISEPDLVGEAPAHFPLLEINTCGPTLIILPQAPLEILGRSAVHFPEWLSRILFVRAIRARLAHFDPGLRGDHPEGRRPVAAESLGQELEHVARFMADEAVVHHLLRRHREVALRALMKGTGSTEVRTLTLELHVFTDHAD